VSGDSVSCLSMGLEGMDEMRADKAPNICQNDPQQLRCAGRVSPDSTLILLLYSLSNHKRPLRSHSAVCARADVCRIEVGGGGLGGGLRMLLMPLAVPH
jgi:hypothetical protein